MVWVYCDIRCFELAQKWTTLQIRLERFILETDSLSYPGYVGLSFSVLYIEKVLDIIEVATGLGVFFYKPRRAYVVDTRHFNHSGQPYICPCGHVNTRDS